MINTLKDISIVIPTYNRSEHLKETLKSVINFNVKEIIIVDQSENNSTKELIEGIEDNRIRHIYSEIPSITIARNKGVDNVNKESKIICFIDDDVELKESYFEGILKVFNDYSESKCVGGFVVHTDSLPEKRFSIFLKKLFFLNTIDKDNARIISAYANSYPIQLDKVINAQWIPGVNMNYKKEVFNEQRFDENLLGYTVAEDMDFSYRLFKRYPQSLFVTPFAGIIHKGSPNKLNKEMSYINQVDHFYFYLKNLDNCFTAKLKFVWSIIGISILRTGKVLVTRKRKDWLKLKFYYLSLFYCLFNLRKIKNGGVRFQNEKVYGKSN